ncbi:hypothetical protein AND_009321 [Anopheles darlingi]|uniref:Zinc finger protein n=1 Tax=Anopheles darlingi TaxID=43151 RepID=W5J6R3_ANODA|nr:hypothetical protein AND_009321 [Anopheles darlingi]
MSEIANFADYSSGNVLLYDSRVCRLCGEENENGLPLFRNGTVKGVCEISQLINRYLPVAVQDDGISPRWICPGCHIQLESTAQFFEMILKGQQLVEQLLFREIEREKERELAVASKNTTVARVEDLGPLYDTLLDQAKWNELFSKAEISVTACVGNDLPPLELHELEDLLKPTNDKDTRQDQVPFIAEEESPVREPSTDEANELGEKDWIVNSDVSKAGGRLIGFVQNHNATDIGSLVVVESTTGSSRTQAKFICDICAESFAHERRYVRHRKTHAVLFECSDCLVKFGTTDKLKLHQQQNAHRGQGIVDGIQFNKKKAQRVQSVSHGTEKVDQYACDNCDNTFPELQTVLKHEETVHVSENRTYVCSACGKSFRQKDLLKRHQSTHTEGRPHRCTVCEAAFKTRSTLSKHTKLHDAEVKRFPCTLCDLQFRYKAGLKQHLNVHAGVKPFQCQYCERRFSQRGNLKEHLRTHSGDKPFSCDSCEARFSTSSQQRMHVMRHNSARPHGCELCSKTFIALEAYKTHMRRHRNEKPFGCSDCPRSFFERWALRKHIRTHTLEKPYTCKYCGKAFSDSSNMTRHVATIHGGERKGGKVESSEEPPEPADQATVMTMNNEVDTMVTALPEDELLSLESVVLMNDQ